MLSRLSVRARMFLKAEDGLTAVEYSIMLSVLMVLFVAAVAFLGPNAGRTRAEVSKQISSWVP